MPFWFPPTLDEQLEISAFIDSQVSAYDQMARPRKSKVENVGGLMEEFVSLVAERTSAIITAAVTGQIDTTKAA